MSAPPEFAFFEHQRASRPRVQCGRQRPTAFSRILMQLSPGFLCREPPDHLAVRTSGEQMGASMSNPSFERSCLADAHARRRGLLGGAGGCAWGPDKIGVGVGSNETRLASRRGRLHGEPLVSAPLAHMPAHR